MPIKAIIHDWDDTITNAFQTYSQFYFDLGKHYNLEQTSIEKIKVHWGHTIPEIVAGAFPSLSLKDATNLTNEFINKCGPNYRATTFKNNKETFEKLYSKGIKLGVISSGARFMIEEIYRTQIEEHLKFHEFIFDSNDLGVKKPDPKVFDKAFEILSQYEILENETIYVGDSFHDYEAALNRGLIFYAVTTGVKSKQDFLNTGLAEEFVLENFNEILEVV